MTIEKEIHSEFWFPQQIIVHQDLQFHKIKNKFIDYCKKRQKEDVEGRNYSNCLGWQSKDILSIDFVSDYLQESIEQSLFSQLNVKERTNIIINNFWINISPKYASNDYHIHNGSHYSGCFYVQCENRSGSIKINPNINFNTDWMSFLSDEYKNAYHIQPSVEFEPKEGMMILFPSYLTHKVNNNLSNRDRISIAFNVSFYKSN
jgi:uncharacterized protein (TIGR02466 family)